MCAKRLLNLFCTHLHALQHIGVTESNDFHIGQLDFQINRITVALRYADAAQVEWIEALDAGQTRYACVGVGVFWYMYL